MVQQFVFSSKFKAENLAVNLQIWLGLCNSLHHVHTGLLAVDVVVSDLHLGETVLVIENKSGSLL